MGGVEQDMGTQVDRGHDAFGWQSGQIGKGRRLQAWLLAQAGLGQLLGPPGHQIDQQGDRHGQRDARKGQPAPQQPCQVAQARVAEIALPRSDDEPGGSGRGRHDRQPGAAHLRQHDQRRADQKHQQRRPLPAIIG